MVGGNARQCHHCFHFIRREPETSVSSQLVRDGKVNGECEGLIAKTGAYGN